ncbi:hypothetical protein HH212_21025 [Massilia forsythiae]|uniref:Uncharacterized protein n=1 Tax=Massilia forsythiae TaxID=2728020 RepID=A0A7Z2W0I2_9BURK|nr:hypothetical protein [Massilia forsythiae]QJE02195.1 hypothetical protein HH212_21025 [Massilia forsythiae]
MHSHPMLDLPPPDTLKCIMQSLSMLDAILEEEWEFRYFSFDSSWSLDTQMGSMRNGQGDDLFAVFDPTGCFIRGFDHEAAMSPWALNPPKIWPGVLEHVPKQFSSSLTEPAFHMEDTTFCLWFLADAQAWNQGQIAYPLASDPDGSSWMLSYYMGGPQTYRDFAEHYYEVDIPAEVIARFYKHEPLSSALIQALGSRRSYDQLVVEAATIGYPTF